LILEDFFFSCGGSCLTLKSFISSWCCLTYPFETKLVLPWGMKCELLEIDHSHKKACIFLVQIQKCWTKFRPLVVLKLMRRLFYINWFFLAVRNSVSCKNPLYLAVDSRSDASESLLFYYIQGGCWKPLPKKN